MYRIFGHYIPKTLLLLGLTELLILWLSTFIANCMREGISYPGINQLNILDTVVFCGVMFAIMACMGLYRRDLRDNFHNISLRIVASLLFGLLIIYSLDTIAPELLLDRQFFLTSVLCAIIGLPFCRLFWYRQTEKYLTKRVLVFGAGERARQLESLRRKTDRYGIEIVGFINFEGGEKPVISESNILKHVNGEPFNVLEFIQENNINEIIIALDEREHNFPANQILECKLKGLQVVDVNAFLERQIGKLYLNTMRPTVLIYSDGFKQNQFREISKRMLDIVISTVMLILTLPIMLLTIVAIFVESGFRGSIIYRQERAGVDNRPFNIFKFRSMSEDAEHDGVAKWASIDDNRVTRIGAFIRKTRIDELPQLINVLRGEMSFVGPRPERPTFVEDLVEKIPFYGLRQHIKPGITGWAQICYPYGASINDAKEKLQYDLYYLKNHNVFLDLLILAQTAAVILMARGAR